MSILLKNCRLIPELSANTELKIANILVDDGKIAMISASDGETVSANEVLDCKGKTLLPGLIDLHMHICTVGCGIGTEYKNDFDTMARACKSAQAYLDHGYTTIRDMGSTNGVACAVRDLIASKVLRGPRIIASNKMIVPAGMLEGSDKNTAYHSVSGVTEVERAVREEIGESRANIVKIYASGSAYNATGEPHLPTMTREEIRAAVQMANFRERKVAAHCHSNMSIHMCIDEGVHTIEHGSYIDEKGIEKLKFTESYLVPTLSPYHYVPNSNPDPAMNAMFEQVLPRMGETIGAHMALAYQAGLLLGFGTDSADGNFHSRIGVEFRQRKELCGMSNIDMLLQSTKNSAFIAGLEKITGEIREGLSADLILMDGEPDNDISAMYQKPDLVMLEGTITRNDCA